MISTRDLARTDAEAVIADLAGSVLDLAPAEVTSIDATTRLDAAGLALDSLARLELATAVATFFRLHESELEDALLRGRRVGDWADTVMHAWAHGSRRLTFTTSGTTGPPARCTHGWDALARELDDHARMFADRRRIVGLVGPRHIYGFLFCVLLPRWLGIPFLDARATAPAGLASRTRSGDLVVGFPLRWDLAVAGPPWMPDITGVTSTGPIAAATIAALRENGLARMVEIYGSSETGGVGWRDDPAGPLHFYPRWSLGEDGMLLRADPDAPDGVQAFESPDVLKPCRGGFEVLRRRDGAVQIAGVNVSCEHVAAVIADHPHVLECAVRPMRADEGARLKAFVVLAESIAEDAARTALRAWISARLSAPERPSSLTFGAALPRDAHGKIADWSRDRAIQYR